MERRFSLFRRRDRGGIFYAQLWNDDTGCYMTAKSTGMASRNTALAVVAGWLRDGWPTGRQAEQRPVPKVVALDTILSQVRGARLTAEDAGRILAVLKERDLIDSGVVKANTGSELLAAYLERFWTYETSPYVREKVAHGQRIGRRRCYDALIAVRAHWAPRFTDTRLLEVTRASLRDFGLALTEEGLAPKTINNILEYGTVALRWAADNELIPSDPSRGVRRFSGDAKARGVLTPEEAGALFRVRWPDVRLRVGNLLAATTGLRAGEVVGLQARDIGEHRIHVRHSWSEHDGLKGTKTNQERTVPLLPSVREEVLALLAPNPHGHEETAFVFYGADAARPMRGEVLRQGLEAALMVLSLPDAEDRRDAAKVKAAWDA